MTKQLIHWFIKNNERTADSAVRRQYIRLGSIVGMVCNLLLFSFKLVVGLLAGSVSILADAFNNLSDIGSSTVTVIGFHLSEKPADKKHPFGHGRIEYMSALLVSVLIILVGVELLKSSVDKILHPAALKIEGYTLLVLSISILIKLWMFFFHRTIGRRIDSSAMLATAQDAVNDAISTGATLLSVLICKFSNINIDPYIGLAVALFILYSGTKTIKETIDPLLGMPPEQKTIDAIFEIVLSYEEFLGIHDLIIHNYGPGRSFASLHVEVASDIDIVSCHETIDACEKRMMHELGLEVVIHMDPIVTGDAAVLATKEAVKKAVFSVDPRLSIHDFRMVDGKNQINLIFDVVIPNEYPYSNEVTKDKIATACRSIDPRYVTVLTLDRDYVSNR